MANQDDSFYVKQGVKMENINDLQNKIIADIQNASDLKTLDEVRVSVSVKRA